MNSLLHELLDTVPDLCAQMYFKSSLTALSHAIEDLVLAGEDSPMVIANFQQERFYHQEMMRYRQIAQRTDQVYVLAVPEPESKWDAARSEPYEMVPLAANDLLSQEWHLIVVGYQYAGCIVCREKIKPETLMDRARQFEGIWSFDRRLCAKAARLLLERIREYRPDLAAKVEKATQLYGLKDATSDRTMILSAPATIDSGVFAHRLVTHLQVTQDKLIQAYRAIAAREKKERLINAIAAAIRSSLNPEQVLAVAVEELGEVFPDCRCVLYQCHPDEKRSSIEYEWVPPQMPSVKGEIISLARDPLFKMARPSARPIALSGIANPELWNHPGIQEKIERWQIQSLVMMPIRYQGKLLGMVELHHGREEAHEWDEDDFFLIEAIATQIGVALAQAQAYSNSQTLNRQLEALERTQTNLIAIVGQELRTPLSTIQVCLESLANEPEMSLNVRQSMLETALCDADRLRNLIQDFLTLSKLESGQAYRRPESIQFCEVLDLVLSSIKIRSKPENLPEIYLELPPELPPLRADGEGLVEVLNKLIDNACKFTGSAGEVRIQAEIRASGKGSRKRRDRDSLVEIIIADTGRGLDAKQLETLFDRFERSQEFVQRHESDIGLGLVIARQIVEGMGGTLWAESAGKNQGSQFHFTVPIDFLT